MQQKRQLPLHLLHHSLSVLSGIGVHTQQTAAGLAVTRLVLGTSETILFSKECAFLVFQVRSPVKSHQFSAGGFLFASFL